MVVAQIEFRYGEQPCYVIQIMPKARCSQWAFLFSSNYFMKYELKTSSKRLLADTLTPVNIYLKLRDVFAGSVLLESSDYHGNENSLSFICCDPMATFRVANGLLRFDIQINQQIPNKNNASVQVPALLEKFQNSFQSDASHQSKYPHDGLFGYMAYDSVRYFEDLTIQSTEA
jgi:anthranilate synthase component 1